MFRFGVGEGEALHDAFRRIESLLSSLQFPGGEDHEEDCLHHLGAVDEGGTRVRYMSRPVRRRRPPP